MKWMCALLLVVAPLAAADVVRCNETSFHELTPAAPSQSSTVVLNAGDIVAVTMRPLESTLRSVTLRVIAPAESGQVLPEVIGGTDGTVRFVPKVSGSYDIVAGAGTE
ncbi:MAG TPA: hypothetical protein VIW45_21125, partial [Vicinamibacterales bacterium]